ncbi:TetR/AcrR family transcriptional regulator [Nocardia gamkensis]|uniref:TetR/AcrR family transcriptional regulator n=1 Tax=Nocardia gamkensis TaxID=352869 RepID=UPI0037C514B7
MASTEHAKEIRRARRRQADRVAESRERLMEAAISLFAERGYEATSTGAIADRAGYVRSMVNTRYGGKEGLLVAMLQDEWVTRLLFDVSDAPDGLHGALGVIDRLRVFAVEQPARLRAFLLVSFEATGASSIPKDRVSGLLAALDRTIADALRAGVEDGSVDSGTDPDFEAACIVDAGLGMAYRWVVDAQRYDLAGHLGTWREALFARLGSSA